MKYIPEHEYSHKVDELRPTESKDSAGIVGISEKEMERIREDGY